MDDVWYVYRHRRLDSNTIFYVGIGKASRFFRAYSKAQRSKWWKSVINICNYEVEILAKNLTKTDACELECFLIKEYGRKDLKLGTLVNMTDGGDGGLGKKHSEETRLKISTSNKGKKGMLGEENPSWRKKKNPNSLIKQSLTMKGRVRSEASKEKQSKTLVEQYKLGKVHPLKGRVLSLEEKERISIQTTGGNNPTAKKVVDITTGVTYSCIKEAAEFLGIRPNNLRRYLNPNNNRKNKTNLKYE
jgi:group I intron endonuclease